MSGRPTTDDRRRTADAGSLAIIVVSYNVCDLLRACLTATLASLVQSGYEVTPSSSVGGPTPLCSGDNSRRSSTIIVIDNASADDSADMVAAEYPQARLVA
ncbi:MAG TPA: hypothetical protein VES39_03290, partial [Rhodospirillales bacterium]|nr:hypothetical protein [Rhodospirillales bacterium]